MHACASAIERKLADRYAHAADALIAEAKNALAAAHDDRFDIVNRGLLRMWLIRSCNGKLRNKPRGLRGRRLNC